MALEQTASTTRWELYRVLAEPVRLRLLALSAAEELTIGELADLVGESQPNVSRHTQALKQAGLVTVRKQGTRALVRLHGGVVSDAVVADALQSGRALAEEDGSLIRVHDVVRQREAPAREFFEAPGEAPSFDALPPELSAYMRAFAMLLPSRGLAIDAGTGDGALLDVLSPAYERVVAVDRSRAQLDRARERVEARGYGNVELWPGELDDASLVERLRGGADVVFAVRLLHHAPKPVEALRDLARLLARPHKGRPGGALVVVDYARHEDESMRKVADVWLGFDEDELARLAKRAGLAAPEIAAVPPPRRGPDAHLPWQVMVTRLPGA